MSLNLSETVLVSNSIDQSSCNYIYDSFLMRSAFVLLTNKNWFLKSQVPK